MILPKKKYTQLQQDIVRATTVANRPLSKYQGTGDTIYYAAVDLESNAYVVAENGVYVYHADLYYKQCTEQSDNPDTYDKDVDLEQYKAGTGIIFISTWDLQVLIPLGTLPIVVLPCVNRNRYFENLMTMPMTPQDTTGKPWDMVIGGTSGAWTITFSNCLYQRGGLTKLLADKSFALTPTNNENYWCGVKISALTMQMDNTLLISTNLANVTHATNPSPTDPEADYLRLLLYRLTLLAGTWSMILDCRTLPELGVRI